MRPPPSGLSYPGTAPAPPCHRYQLSKGGFSFFKNIENCQIRIQWPSGSGFLLRIQTWIQEGILKNITFLKYTYPQLEDIPVWYTVFKIASFGIEQRFFPIHNFCFINSAIVIFCLFSGRVFLQHSQQA